MLTSENANAVNVLDEREFTEKVSHIIRRDFFPVSDEAEKSSAEDEYANERLAESVIDTPLQGSRGEYIECSRSVRKGKIEELAGISLDQFLSSNTSCDNIAFERVIEKLERVDRVKPRYAWLFQNDAQKALETTFDEAGQPISERHLTRPVETWTFNAKNSLMYYPDGIGAISTCDRRIVHANTRLPIEAVQYLNRPARLLKNNDNQSPLPILTLNSPYSSATNCLDARQEYLKRASMMLQKNPDSGLSSALTTPSSWLAARYSKKRRALGTLVPSTPTIEPGVESPFMTWGEVESTPLAVSGNNTPSFRIPDTPERDVIARRLAEDAGSGSRMRKKTILRHLNHSVRGTPDTFVNAFDDISTPQSVSGTPFQSPRTDMSTLFQRRLERTNNNKRPILAAKKSIRTANAGLTRTPIFASPSIVATSYLTRHDCDIRPDNNYGIIASSLTKCATPNNSNGGVKTRGSDNKNTPGVLRLDNLISKNKSREHSDKECSK